MRTALQQLLSDFLSALVFLVLYLSTDNVTLATSCAIAAGLAQVAVMKFLGRPIDAMQWLALGLVAVLGAATLVTQDGRFIMAKPTAIHWAIGTVMLRRGWMARYLPPEARERLPLKVMVASGYAWAGLMFLLGAMNLFIAVAMSFEAWAWFITVVAGGSKVVLFLAQYWLFRSIIRRNSVAQPAQPQTQSSSS
jgi:intracellular septation protein